MLTGTILNALGILIGGLMGLTRSRQFSPATQTAIRGFMGFFTIYVASDSPVKNLAASSLPLYKQIVILLLALILGRFLGQLFRIQKTFNRLGQSRQPTLRPGPARGSQPHQ